MNATKETQEFPYLIWDFHLAFFLSKLDSDLECFTMIKLQVPTPLV